MKIWLIRHGETSFNKQKIMQGRTDVPLSPAGIAQARAMKKKLGEVRFDAVYSSPLCRALQTASIVSGWEEDRIITDERLLEVNFGKYEGRHYSALGPAMTLFWACPEIFPAPDTVETLDEIRTRSHAFLRELEREPYENVLVAAHGGILRGLNGYLLDRKNGFRWRPKTHNCEVRVYRSENGRHTFLADYRL